ncbi:DeoR/GlpR family transcriptional regulator of sugar metabolism [Arthrobacter pascens]|uniref:DeoR/GlpR family DNA-binding transcription regulator n=1 Tax=Arthrobacter pascens TaxID=1677 RepID=UPI002781213D|nr:DeoR/GlpR family DNA-binding transcription regulator [Arthrobacter pascens]MDQ0634901.1 DeoR/GlpR family transcriptional regulator of sugar metabolism [Arthrobacter pascens]
MTSEEESMLAAQRQHLILQEVQAQGTVRVAVLAGLFEVSEMTIRRDIDALDASGLVLRVHGGAVRTDSLSALEPAFASKSARQLAAKAAIAAEAALLVEPGMTLLISGGTTTFELARILPRNLGLTVATNSIMVANSLAGSSADHDGGIRTLILGGERTPSEALVGPLAAGAVRTVDADLCFMGVHGMDPQAGITSPNLLEAELNAAMIEASRKLIVLADATKYGVVGLAGICALSAIDTLITDTGITELPAGFLAALREAIPDVRVAAVPAGRDGPTEQPTITASPPEAEQLPVPVSKGQKP